MLYRRVGGYLHSNFVRREEKGEEEAIKLTTEILKQKTKKESARFFYRILVSSKSYVLFISCHLICWLLVIFEMFWSNIWKNHSGSKNRRIHWCETRKALWWDQCDANSKVEWSFRSWWKRMRQQQPNQPNGVFVQKMILENSNSPYLVGMLISKFLRRFLLLFVFLWVWSLWFIRPPLPSVWYL